MKQTGSYDHNQFKQKPFYKLEFQCLVYPCMYLDSPRAARLILTYFSQECYVYRNKTLVLWYI